MGICKALLLKSLLIGLEVNRVRAFIPRTLGCRAMKASPMKTSTTPQDAITSQDMQLLEGIRELAHDYDLFLLDMWGVMHDGTRPYEGVIECVRQLNQAGKSLVILSNSSKRVDHSKKMLRKLGFDPETDFDLILTSGEVSHRLLSGDADILNICSWSPIMNLIGDEANKKVLVFGSGDDDAEYVQSAGWSLATSVTEAKLLIARGTFTIVQGEKDTVYKKESPVKYDERLAEILKEAATYQIPMLVCNPDKVRPDEGLPPMPGAIGDAYVLRLLEQTSMSKQNAELLVKRIGKPYRELYQLALKSSSTARACMVGDSLETDITGGMKFLSNGATVWIIQDGIHGPTVREAGVPYPEAVQKTMDTFNAGSAETPRMGQEEGFMNIRPNFVLQHFNW